MDPNNGASSDATSVTEGLNSAQAEAVTHEAAALLVVAGAGSGKTRVLTRRIAYLIATGRARPHEILAITFTNKAAREMRDRVRSLVGDAAGRMVVSTFHSACVRILRSHHEAAGVPSTFSIYDSADSLNLIKQVMRERDVDPKAHSPKAIAAAISSFKDELVEPEAALAAAEGVPPRSFEAVAASIYAGYQSTLHSSGAVDFDDIIVRTVRMIQGHPDVAQALRERFRHVLVDEYQDTNHAQYVLVRELVGASTPTPGTLTVVGDSDQSIYAFRGASIRNILEFEKDFPGAATVRLEQNYRSTHTILSAANAVIERNPDRVPTRLWTDSGEGSPVVGYVADSEHAEAQFVCDEIRSLVDAGTERRGDIAVMYRTNSLSRVLEERLIRAEIPYVLVGGTRFYERREVKDVLAYLAAIANENDDGALRRIINVPRRGIGDASIQALEAFRRVQEAAGSPCTFGQSLRRLEEISGVSSRGRAALQSFVSLIDELRAEAAGPIASLIEQVTSRTGYLDVLRNSDDPQDATRVDNILELIAVGREFSEENPDGTLADFLEKVALVADADQIPEDSGGTGLVTLMTLHTAKGLEFSTVFLVGLEEGTFPHQRALDDPKELAEERRLAYVGITRARRQLYVSRAAVRSTWGAPVFQAPSRFLDEIPSEVMEWRREESSMGMWHGREGAAGGVSRSWSSAGYGGSSGQEDGHVFGSGRTPSLRQAPPSPPGSTPVGDLGFDIGDRVTHDTYGMGTVVALEGGGRSAVAKVDFGDTGIKRLALRHARLIKL